MKIRIEKHPKGYVVEELVQHRTLFRTKEVWETYITYNGSDDPFYFRTFGTALGRAASEIKDDIIRNSK